MLSCRTSGRFGPVVAVALILVAGALAGCGFKPLYGQGEGSVSARELDTVQVEHLRDREGQMLRTLLMQRFNPDGRRAAVQYKLSVNLQQSISNLGVRRDATATRANLSLTATFRLVETANGKTAFNGKSAITVSYNILDDRFATVAAQQNALERALRVIADNIKIRVSAYLTRDKAPA